MELSVIKGMTSNQLLSQYEEQSDFVDVCWDNINDGSGDTAAHEADADNMVEAEAACKMIQEEIKERYAAHTLFDGKFNDVQRVIAWSKNKIHSNEQLAYNVARKVLREKYDVYLPKYHYSYIIDIQ